MFPCEDSKTVSVCPSVCLSICPYPEKRNLHIFVNISPTIVIDTSMERSSQVLHDAKPKIWFFFFFKKVRNSNFDLCWRAEITLASSISALHWQLIHQWKGLQEYYNMETQKLDFFFKKVRNSNFDLCWRAEITLASSISALHWQLIHQWKGLQEYYNMETQKLDFFFKKVRNSNFDLCWSAEITLASSISVLH